MPQMHKQEELKQRNHLGMVSRGWGHGGLKPVLLAQNLTLNSDADLLQILQNCDRGTTLEWSVGGGAWGS